MFFLLPFLTVLLPLFYAFDKLTYIVTWSLAINRLSSILLLKLTSYKFYFIGLIFVGFLSILMNHLKFMRSPIPTAIFSLHPDFAFLFLVLSYFDTIDWFI